MTIRTKPSAYHFMSWHEFGNTQFSCHVPKVLDALRAPAGGQLPDALGDEAQVRAFADLCGIPLAAPDVEAALIMPHRFYASREWVRGEYKKFLGFCRASGWLDGGPEAMDAQPRRRPGRPRKNPLPA